ncbi:MAG: hypothetical protein JW720_04350 [Sedimentisphaerales bacterium]|nr:hypothetical protein [Sedimentisphaerales bacterium]
MNAELYSRPTAQRTGFAAQPPISKTFVRLPSSLPCLLSSVICCLLLVGCSGRQTGDNAVVEQVPQVCLGDIDKTSAMSAVEEVLVNMRFTIEKANPQTGLIRTKPLSGAQFFEFWRKDSLGGFNKAEANLHSIRRTVEVEVAAKDTGMCIGCDVRTQRLNLPEREVSSSARAYELFSKSSASMQRLRFNPQQEAAVAWVDLGSDTELACELLEQIERQILQPGRVE